MTKQVYTIIIAGGLLMGAGACSKARLNPTSTTSLSDASAFSTADRISNQVNSLYAALKSGNFYGGRYLIYNDVRGDNFINVQNNVVTARSIYDFSVPGNDNEVNSLWNDAYAAINKVNVFLDGMENKGGKEVAGDEKTKNYEAEAKVVRAISYYSLLQLYARPYVEGSGSNPGLPLRLTPITGSGSNNLARSTVAEVYAQILKDLNEAETDLPLDYDDADLNTTHAHRNTAVALKVRAYLSMGDWTNVITEASKIVPTGAPFAAPSGVANDLEADIAAVFTTYTTPESILSMPFTGANEAPGTQNELAYYYTPDVGNSEYYLNPSGIIGAADWKTTDARRKFIMVDDGKSWLIKYHGGSPYVDWVPVIRYTEVMLAYAEALVRKNNTVDATALAILNAVRHRSDATTTLAPASASDLIDAILHERDIEFLGEGVRGPDITRLDATFPAKGAVNAVSPSTAGYIFPAPTSETQYNTLW